jgi:hypothetical protein
LSATRQDTVVEEGGVGEGKLVIAGMPSETLLWIVLTLIDIIYSF